VGYIARIGDMRNGPTYTILKGEPEGKKPFGRPRRKWEANEMDIKDMGCEGVDSIQLAQNTVR
jgi:hypothetical protein